MIKPQDNVFANLITQLHRDLPREPLTRVGNLAAIALGILRSKRLQVGQILTALPLAGTRDTLKKRVQGFLKNPEVTVELYYEPLARRIRQRLASGGARVQWVQGVIQHARQSHRGGRAPGPPGDREDELHRIHLRLFHVPGRGVIQTPRRACNQQHPANRYPEPVRHPGADAREHVLRRLSVKRLPGSLGEKGQGAHLTPEAGSLPGCR